MLKILVAVVIGGIGAGIGYGSGWLGGMVVGGVTSGVNGMCTAVDVAVNQKMLTPDQAQQVGAAMVQRAVQQGSPADGVKSMLQISPQNPSQACQQFRKGIAEAKS